MIRNPLITRQLEGVFVSVRISVRSRYAMPKPYRKHAPWPTHLLTFSTVHVLGVFGFSPRQADRLVALKIRYERGAFRELTTAQKRLLFVRWLVRHNHLSDG